MVYKNQNYMTNAALKEQADKAQKDYVEPESQNSQKEEDDSNQGNTDNTPKNENESKNQETRDNPEKPDDDIIDGDQEVDDEI